MTYIKRFKIFNILRRTIKYRLKQLSARLVVPYSKFVFELINIFPKLMDIIFFYGLAEKLEVFIYTYY